MARTREREEEGDGTKYESGRGWAREGVRGGRRGMFLELCLLLLRYGLRVVEQSSARSHLSRKRC